MRKPRVRAKHRGGDRVSNSRDPMNKSYESKRSRYNRTDLDRAAADMLAVVQAGLEAELYAELDRRADARDAEYPGDQRHLYLRVKHGLANVLGCPGLVDAQLQALVTKAAWEAVVRDDALTILATFGHEARRRLAARHKRPRRRTA